MLPLLQWLIVFIVCSCRSNCRVQGCLLLLTWNLYLLNSLLHILILVPHNLWNKDIHSNALISVSVFDKYHPELGNLFQGDIILPKGRNALLVKEYLWPNGIVPYVFHKNYSKLHLKDQSIWGKSIAFSRKSINVQSWNLHFIHDNCGVKGIIPVCHAGSHKMHTSYWLPNEGVNLGTLYAMAVFLAAESEAVRKSLTMRYAHNDRV